MNIGKMNWKRERDDSGICEWSTESGDLLAVVCEHSNCYAAEVAIEGETVFYEEYADAKGARRGCERFLMRLQQDLRAMLLGGAL